MKRICNQPDQYLGQNDYIPADSGKFAMLKELCETIYEKRGRVIFHRKGYVIHGGTPVKKRAEIVDLFQSEKYVPFIVLSVKAAGTGLNLTKANHVIHFDRWWNPCWKMQKKQVTGFWMTVLILAVYSVYKKTVASFCVKIKSLRYTKYTKKKNKTIEYIQIRYCNFLKKVVKL